MLSPLFWSHAYEICTLIFADLLLWVCLQHMISNPQKTQVLMDPFKVVRDMTGTAVCLSEASVLLLSLIPGLSFLG